MIIPVAKPYRITSPYGDRWIKGESQFHKGIDFVSETGLKDVLSIADGIVTYDQDDYDEAQRWTDRRHSAGNMVIIRHELKSGLYYIRYLHLGSNKLVKGQKVFEQAKIGEYSDAGISYGAHLHVDAYDMHWIHVDISKLFKEEGLL